jgi:hypothetical protein
MSDNPQMFFTEEQVGGLVLKHVECAPHDGHSGMRFVFEDGSFCHGIVLADRWVPTFGGPVGDRWRAKTGAEPVMITRPVPVADTNGSGQ